MALPVLYAPPAATPALGQGFAGLVPTATEYLGLIGHSPAAPLALNAGPSMASSWLSGATPAAAGGLGGTPVSLAANASRFSAMGTAVPAGFEGSVGGVANGTAARAAAGSSLAPAAVAGESTAAAAANAGKLGLIRGVGARVPLAGIGGTGTVAAAAPYAIGGLLAGSYADGLNLGGKDSKTDRTTSDALRGAGTGAALGTLIAPGIGTAIGGGLGALGGGAWGYFHGSDPHKKAVATYDKTLGTLTQAIKEYGVDPDTAKQLTAQFKMQAQQAFDNPGSFTDANGKSLFNSPQDAMKAIAGQTLNALPQIVSDSIATQKATREDNARQIATQALMGQVLAPYLEQSKVTSDQTAAQYNKWADQVQASDPAQAAGYRAYASKKQSDTAKLSAAYMMQVAQYPQAEALRKQQEAQAQITAQLAQQAQAKAVASVMGGGGGGGTDLASLMAAAGQQ